MQATIKRGCIFNYHGLTKGLELSRIITSVNTSYPNTLSLNNNIYYMNIYIYQLIK